MTDYMNIVTIIGSLLGCLLGIISFILYFPLKRNESRAKSENDSVDTLSKVVDELKSELERSKKEKKESEERVDALEVKTKSLQMEVTYLKKELMDRDASVIYCNYYQKYGKCPIIDKKNENEKSKRSIKNSPKKEAGCKKGRDLRGK